MGLDINTEKGQETILQENDMLNYIEKCWGVKIETTKKDQPIPYDGTILFNDIISGIFESKNRQCSLEDMIKWGSWLITYEKFEKCRKIAIKMKVPFYGFLGMEKSKGFVDPIIFCWKIIDEHGIYMFDFKHRNSSTQATINGGVANRDNAYLPLCEAKLIRPNQLFYLI
jgi:hypothetical protein